MELRTFVLRRRSSSELDSSSEESEEEELEELEDDVDSGLGERFLLWLGFLPFFDRFLDRFFACLFPLESSSRRGSSPPDSDTVLSAFSIPSIANSRCMSSMDG